MIGAPSSLSVTCFIWGTVASPAIAQIFCSEFLSDPVSEGWDLIQEYCADTWVQTGWYYQQLDRKGCPRGPGGADVYWRWLEGFNGTPEFFAEFRVQTNGDRSEIPGGAPALVVLANDPGVIYHMTISRDLVKFARNVALPIWFIEIEPDVPHVLRIELTSGRYAFYIDADLIDEGVSEGPFPADNPRISWRGRSWYLPCLNAWDYFRVGQIPEDGSGDDDRDGVLTLFDQYFVADCLTKDGPGIFGGPDNDAGPGCRFTDFDADADTDLADFAVFQNHFNNP
jgi:hypothetical protein